MFKNIPLVGDICDIDLFIVVISPVAFFMLGRAFDFIDCPAGVFLFKNVYRTIKTVIGKGRLTKDGRSLIHLDLCAGDHFGKIGFISVVCRYLNIVTEKPLSQIADLVACLHA